MARIGFIGLGHMGGPMAANLVKAGHAVQGFDLVPVALASARGAGVMAVASAREAVQGTEIVITMLPAGRHVVSVYEEVLEATAPGALLIDASTVDIASARTAHGLAEAHGLDAVDAPVSGGVAGAEGAMLTFMAGGSEAAIARAMPVLEAMGKRVVHCGGPGAGQAAKICNNMILGISMIGISEAFVLGEKLGLTHQAVFDVASTSSGQCWALVNHCPVPGPVPASAANRDYKPGFATALMLKDLTLSQAAAREAGAATPLGQAAQTLYERFAAAGNADLDYSAIVTFIRDTLERPS
ncbi:MAG TPA: 3-hydroxyisobutyrate dehydrogenase [Lichenihabitans sp.]|nr:3-hydroxyisobutyrate dehydrogenase [Lichenihabitans sp.]